MSFRVSGSATSRLRFAELLFENCPDNDVPAGKALKQEMPSFPALQQAGVRYAWYGEQAYGMLERSNPLDKIAHD